ncbi:hypothetical protein BDF20DRAFT_863739 [Mycotypha africana]|uniref:uncharacterized protein n=1 Tax=Mycotypha africana TaxID=64632 RepID=UPI0023018F9E|nr:uncharacterized protein BDF20DRAFT_863739 [Mycotypha africana]KAI8981879.1 hypothetical protein BDF20DRAFT_863739 [Mycotypha africana]
MVFSLELQEKIVSQNSMFIQNMSIIESIQEQLLKRIVLRSLSSTDYDDAKDYIQDKVTIFRFLKEADFDEEVALQKLDKVLAWRIEQHIARLTYQDCSAFFSEDGALTFFHKVDISGHFPLVFVKLANFPSSKRLYATNTRSRNTRRRKLVNYVQPYACFVMEMARKLTWDMTKERMKRNEQYVLVAEIMALVDVSKAPMIPIDAELIRAMSVILDDRFPSMVDSIHVFNFSWVYQGLWSVLKHLLSEKAKRSIQFNTVKDVQSIISEDCILTEMGGIDDYIWSVMNDVVLQKYGTGASPKLPEDELTKVAVRPEAEVQQHISSRENAADTLVSPVRVKDRLANSTNNNRKQAVTPLDSIDAIHTSPTIVTATAASDASSDNDIFFDAINDSSTSSSPSISIVKQAPQTDLAQLPRTPPLSANMPPPSFSSGRPMPPQPQPEAIPNLSNAIPVTPPFPSSYVQPFHAVHQNIPAQPTTASVTQPMPHAPFYSWGTTELRTGLDILTSFITKRRTLSALHQRQCEQQQKQQHPQHAAPAILNPSLTPTSSSVIVVDNPSTATASNAAVSTTSLEQKGKERPIALITTEKHNHDKFIITFHLQALHNLFQHYTHSLFHWTFGHRGLIYWAFLYLFLRGPVESLAHHSILRLQQSFITGHWKPRSFLSVGSVTMGVTATVAAIMNSGLSSIIDKFSTPTASKREGDGKTKRLNNLGLFNRNT